MICNKVLLAAIVAALAGFVAAHADPNDEKMSDEELILKGAECYCAAFNSGDVDALLTMWADDADYVDVDGNIHRGKAEVGAMFRDSLKDLTGYALDVKVDSLRMVVPGVAIEDGATTLTGPDGETTSSRYMAVLVKSGDKWRIQSGRELASDEKSDTRDNGSGSSDGDGKGNLQSFEWLIGAWSSDDKGPTVHVTNKWALDKKFILQEYTVSGKKDDDLHVVQWIGLDPLSGQIKSWTFDSRGGYGEGFWTSDADSWIEKSSGVLPDGRTGSSDNTLRFIDDTHFEWRSASRNVDGQPMPDVEVSFVRDPTTENTGTP